MAREGSLQHPCPLLEGSEGALRTPARPQSERVPGAVHIASSPGTLPHGFHSTSHPSGMSHLSLRLRQQLPVCLLKCRLACFFYKFLGITIDFLAEDFESLPLRLLRFPCCSNNVLSFLISPICDTLFTWSCRGLALAPRHSLGISGPHCPPPILPPGNHSWPTHPREGA